MSNLVPCNFCRYLPCQCFQLAFPSYLPNSQQLQQSQQSQPSHNQLSLHSKYPAPQTFAPPGQNPERHADQGYGWSSNHHRTDYQAMPTTQLNYHGHYGPQHGQEGYIQISNPPIGGPPRLPLQQYHVGGCIGNHPSQSDRPPLPQTYNPEYNQSLYPQQLQQSGQDFCSGYPESRPYQDPYWNQPEYYRTGYPVVNQQQQEQSLHGYATGTPVRYQPPGQDNRTSYLVTSQQPRSYHASGLPANHDQQASIPNEPLSLGHGPGVVGNRLTYNEPAHASAYAPSHNLASTDAYIQPHSQPVVSQLQETTQVREKPRPQGLFTPMPQATAHATLLTLTNTAQAYRDVDQHQSSMPRDNGTADIPLDMLYNTSLHEMQSGLCQPSVPNSAPPIAPHQYQPDQTAQASEATRKARADQEATAEAAQRHAKYEAAIAEAAQQAQAVHSTVQCSYTAGLLAEAVRQRRLARTQRLGYGNDLLETHITDSLGMPVAGHIDQLALHGYNQEVQDLVEELGTPEQFGLVCNEASWLKLDLRNIPQVHKFFRNVEQWSNGLTREVHFSPLVGKLKCKVAGCTLAHATVMHGKVWVSFTHIVDRDPSLSHMPITALHEIELPCQICLETDSNGNKRPLLASLHTIANHDKGVWLINPHSSLLSDLWKNCKSRRDIDDLITCLPYWFSWDFFARQPMIPLHPYAYGMDVQKPECLDELPRKKIRLLNGGLFMSTKESMQAAFVRILSEQNLQVAKHKAKQKTRSKIS